MLIPLNPHRKTVLTAILLLLFLTVTVYATVIETFEVSPSNNKRYVFDLSSGRKVAGSFSVEGGNNDINFKVTDPVGNTIIDLERVAGGSSFEFTAHQDGNYTVIFDNSFSISTSKTVTMSYDVGYTFLGIDLLNLLSIIAVVLIVIFVLAIALYVRSRKNRPEAVGTSSSGVLSHHRYYVNSDRGELSRFVFSIFKARAHHTHFFGNVF